MNHWKKLYHMQKQVGDMADYEIVYSKAAAKDIPKLKAANLADKAKDLCESLANNPRPLFSKKLCGDLSGRYSIRINLQHRLVYKIIETKKIVKVVSMWGHYDDN